MSSEYPLVEALKENKRKIKHRFHVPAGAVNPFVYELTELPGLDTLPSPAGVIKEAQEKCAAYFGSSGSFFLVNGSTAGIAASLLATCSRGDKVLLPRNLHSSVVSGLVFSGAEPEFIPVEETAEGFPLNIHPRRVSAHLQEDRYKVVFATSPSYQGVSCDLFTLGEVIEKHGGFFVVDEAHGGHFCFSKEFPASASEAGSNLWVNSAHKTLGALTPGALLHVSGDRVDRDRLQFFLNMLQTSSPSYPVMASLDLVKSIPAAEWDRLLEWARYARLNISRETGFRCLEEEDLPPGFSLDPLRLTVFTAETGLSGQDALNLLRQEFGIEVEMAGEDYFLVIFQPGLEGESVKALLEGLRHLSRRNNKGKFRPPEKKMNYPLPEMQELPADAVSAGWREVKMEEAAGEVSAVTVSVYPPGIPVLIPGEEISLKLISLLREKINRGDAVTGIKENGRMKVVRV